MRGVVLILVIILTAGVFFIIENNKVPANIGVHNGKLSELKKSENGVSSQTSQDSKKVEPLAFNGDVAETKQALIEAFDECGAYEININTENYIHVIFISETMKFKDDLEILIDTKNNLVQYKSQSRLGYSDMGVNLDRYNKISKYYTKRLETLEN
ncbi:MAG: DUF1499 domain-containing protein [Acidaminobacteraceae bacterium]